MSNSMNKDELMKKFGNTGKETKDVKEAKEEKKEKAADVVEVGTSEKKYQLPSAPCTIHFPWEQDKRHVLDGVYVTSDEQEIEYLESMVKARCIFHYEKPSNLREHQIPAPTRKLIDNPGN